jgi:putative oxidoreductase
MVLADVTYGENNMQKLVELYYSIHNALFQRLKYVDGLAPLVLRLYLVPVFWVAGTTKLAGMENTIAWFGNPDWGLGLPFPALWLIWRPIPR